MHSSPKLLAGELWMKDSLAKCMDSWEGLLTTSGMVQCCTFEQPNSIHYKKYDSASILAGGECNDGTWQSLAATNIVPVKLFKWFIAQCINCESYIMPVVYSSQQEPPSITQWSCASYCHSLFLRPDIAMPAFHPALGDSLESGSGNVSMSSELPEWLGRLL